MVGGSTAVSGRAAGQRRQSSRHLGAASGAMNTTSCGPQFPRVVGGLHACHHVAGRRDHAQPAVADRPPGARRAATTLTCGPGTWASFAATKPPMRRRRTQIFISGPFRVQTPRSLQAHLAVGGGGAELQRAASPPSKISTTTRSPGKPGCTKPRRHRTQALRPARAQVFSSAGSKAQVVQPMRDGPLETSPAPLRGRRGSASSRGWPPVRTGRHAAACGTRRRPRFASAGISAGAPASTRGIALWPQPPSPRRNCALQAGEMVPWSWSKARCRPGSRRRGLRPCRPRAPAGAWCARGRLPAARRVQLEMFSPCTCASVDRRRRVVVPERLPAQHHRHRRVPPARPAGTACEPGAARPSSSRSLPMPSASA